MPLAAHRRVRAWVGVVAGAAVAACALPAGAEWAIGLQDDSLSNGYARAAVVFDDDGAGPHAPALYVAGTINNIGGLSAGGVVKWDGQQWTALPPLYNLNSPGAVYALAVFNGQLYVGGTITGPTQGAAGANAGYRGIAKWNGTVWSQVGGGTSGGFTSETGNLIFNAVTVTSLTVHNDGSGDALYAGGNFVKTKSNITCNGIARWNGSAWSALVAPGKTGIKITDAGATVYALKSYDADGPGGNPAELYIAGSFIDTLAPTIVKWNGTNFSAVGSGVAGMCEQIYSLEVFDDDGAGPGNAALYAGSDASSVLRWDGTSWTGHAVGPVNEMRGNSLAVHNDGSGPALYAGFYLAPGGSGDPLSAVVKWNGTTWQQLGAGLTGYSTANGGLFAINAMASFSDGTGTPLYAFGAIGNNGGVMKWNGTAWVSPLTGQGTTDNFTAMTGVDPDGTGPLTPRVYAAAYRGRFGTTTPVDASANNRFGWVGQFDGTHWTILGQGFFSFDFTSGNDGISALAWVDVGGGGGASLYAGGTFAGVPPVYVPPTAMFNSLARWDGTAWQSVGGGVTNGANPGTINAIVQFDADGSGPQAPRLVAAGLFDSAGGNTASNIAQWNGSSWSALGAGVDNEVTAIGVFDDGSGPALYAAGRFITSAGGTPAAGIAKWDGSAWSALDTGITNTGAIRSIKGFTDGSGAGLAVAGEFTEAGGVSVSGVARWNGSSWSAMSLGSLVTYPSNPGNTSLATWDDGTGTALYMANLRSASAGGQRDPGFIGKWDGTQFVPMTAGVGFTARPANASTANLVNILAPAGSGAGSSLYAAGIFAGVDGTPSGNFAHWFTVAPSCPADFNGDHVRDVADLFGYINAWLAKTPNADFNHDTLVDVADLFGFINAWLAGC